MFLTLIVLLYLFVCNVDLFTDDMLLLVCCSDHVTPRVAIVTAISAPLKEVENGREQTETHASDTDVEAPVKLGDLTVYGDLQFLVGHAAEQGDRSCDQQESDEK